MTDTGLLTDKIDESGLKRSFIAEKLGLSPYGLSKKINNESEFKGSEIKLLCQILNIKSLKEKEAIFFAE